MQHAYGTFHDGIAQRRGSTVCFPYSWACLHALEAALACTTVSLCVLCVRVSCVCVCVCACVCFVCARVLRVRVSCVSCVCVDVALLSLNVLPTTRVPFFSRGVGVGVGVGVGSLSVESAFYIHPYPMVQNPSYQLCGPIIIVYCVHVW